MTQRQKTALIMAGGTGGHIFPGLAVAHALQAQGWQVHWLGTPGSMESRIVPQHSGIGLELIAFGGVRGKGLRTLLALPFTLGRACWQAARVMRRVQPDVVLGFGGYITAPGGLMAWLLGKPLLLHEQNSIAGTANRWLAKLARRVFTAFPHVLPGGQWVGNPLRAAFLQQAEPAERFAGRSGPLHLLVVGGSLGAKALNTIVPQALALISPDKRPVVTHQAGEKQFDELQANYAKAGVQATLTPFIQDTASAFAQADLVLCRAGASTVTELAAVGVAAAFVPFPAAVDDHQTHNARFLVDAKAGWLLPQRELTPELLADLLQKLERPQLIARALEAKKMQKTEAVNALVAACEDCAATPKAPTAPTDSSTRRSA